MKKEPCTRKEEAGNKFKARQRIKSRQSFKEIFEKGLFIRGKVIHLWVLKKRDGQKPRAGFIVSRKTSRKATERNLWKRRLREIFRQKQQGVSTGTWLMIKARHIAPVPPFRELEREMVSGLKRAGVMNEKLPGTEKE